VAQPVLVLEATYQQPGRR